MTAPPRFTVVDVPAILALTAGAVFEGHAGRNQSLPRTVERPSYD